MKAKSIVSTVLLLFVAASLVYVVAGGRREAAAPAPEPGVAQANTDDAAASRVVAYYFHGTIRCRTCLAIEASARDVLEAEFPDRFAAGSLEWRSVDMEDPDNEHFVKEFELASGSLVLAEERGGTVTRWKNLEEVWTLIGEDGFDDYVARNTRAFLNAT